MSYSSIKAGFISNPWYLFSSWSCNSSTTLGGHIGIHKTHVRVKKKFFWHGLRSDVRAYVRECDTCRRNKIKTLHPMGLLQPLPILSKNWVYINLDFIEGLPHSGGKTVIIVVVDKLSKYAHNFYDPHSSIYNFNCRMGLHGECI